ncbi:MAG: KH domain-containing protein [Ezakiella sp.]|nr:KH domain-containing protein [Ezakiella sp.]MDD7471558.1 KH domain-containing protein [Bacillota bacterium]MDY3922794.1 KH domain-containing protein [Ezakiella sp.]
MKELLYHIVSNLVVDIDSIEITEEEKANEITYFIKVDEDDMGRLIGKKGKIANSIRTIVRASKNETGKGVFVEIIN